MRIEQPGSFARALPGMLAEVIRHFSRVVPDTGVLLGETDAYRRAGRKCQECRARLTMQVDHHVVTDRPQLRRQLRITLERRPRPRWRARIAHEVDDVVERRVMPP